MKLRKLIEMLCKQDWNAEVSIDTRKDIAPADWCDTSKKEKILSISSFMSRGTPIVTINTRR